MELVETSVGLPGTKPRFPGAILLEDIEIVFKPCQPWHGFEIVGFIVVLSVVADPQPIDRFGLREIDTKPRAVFGIFGHGAAPCHRAVFPVVGAGDGVATFLALLGKPAQSDATIVAGEVEGGVPGTEEFDFINPDGSGLEADANGGGGNGIEMELEKGAPVLFPASECSKVVALPVECLLQFGGAFLPGVIRLEFRGTRPEFDVLENGGHGIVVGEGDGIEFVIVATSATDRHAEDGGTHGLNDFIHPVGASLSNRNRFAANGCRRDMRARNEKPGGGPFPAGIPSQLFANKLVIGFVLVEGSDDIVAIPPRVLAIEVCLGTIGFGPADDIEPVLSPSLTKMGGGQERIDQVDIRGLRTLLMGPQETVCDLRGRGEAGQNNGGSSGQRSRIDEWVGLDSFVFECLREKGVDGMVGALRNPRTEDGLEGPVVGGQFIDCLHLSGPGGSLGNPAFNERDLVAAERGSLGWHPLIGIPCLDEGHEVACSGFTGDDAGEPSLSSPQECGALIDPQLRPLFFRSVAFEAPCFKNRFDVVFEIDRGGLPVQTATPNEEGNDRDNVSGAIHGIRTMRGGTTTRIGSRLGVNGPSKEVTGAGPLMATIDPLLICADRA